MSWSIHVSGKPSTIYRWLDRHVEEIAFQDSRAEFARAQLPLQTLVQANSEDKLLDLRAWGHSYLQSNGEGNPQTRISDCSVNLRVISEDDPDRGTVVLA